VGSAAPLVGPAVLVSAGAEAGVLAAWLPSAGALVDVGGVGIAVLLGGGGVLGGDEVPGADCAGVGVSRLTVGPAASGQSITIDAMTSSSDVGVAGLPDAMVDSADTADSTTPDPPPTGTDAVPASWLVTASVDPPPSAAIAGAAQALVPVRSDTPTAAATNRPAAAGAIRRKSDRPIDPGVPGNRPASAVPQTVTLQINSTQTTRPAVARMAVWAVDAASPRSVTRSALPVTTPSSDRGSGNPTASSANPKTQPTSCSQAARTAEVRRAGGGSVTTPDDCQSVHLASFDMRCSQVERLRICQVGLVSD
jgi:hypothetical protein